MTPGSTDPPAMADAPSASAPRLARSKGTRIGFVMAGHVFLALGIIGAFLPVLPTTVWLILAAACYARGSHAMHEKLLANRMVGPILRDWEEHHAMSVRAKAIAIATLVVTFGTTIVFLVKTPWIRVLHLTLALLLIGVILRIKTKR